MKKNFILALTIKFFLITLFVILSNSMSYSYPDGITGRTLRTSTSGCGGCHGSRDATVGVLISGPSSVTAGQTYTYSVNINKSGKTGAGVDISARSGVLNIISSTLHKSGVELTHNSNITMSGSQITLQFSYTAPLSPVVDTIYATGLATNSNGGESGDLWNWATNFAVTVNPPAVILNLTEFIEGLYSSGTNTMVSDSVTVYLRNSSSPYALVDSAKTVLSSSGNGNYSFSNGVNGTPYYIVVKHRNSLETWSSTTQSFTGNSLSYNFTTASTQAYGNNLKQINSSPLTFGIFSGDQNQDGFVNLSDIVNIFNDANAFVSGYVSSDINGDNITDLNDVVITLNNSNLFVAKVTP